MGKFEFLGEWPVEAKAAVEPSLADLEWLVPAWCDSVSIRWSPISDTGDESASATCQWAYEYRWARIDIHPCFLSDPPKDRRSGLIHELLHVFIGPLSQYAEEMADRLIKDDAPKFHATVREELRVRNESAVQDLAHAILARERSEAA